MVAHNMQKMNLSNATEFFVADSQMVFDEIDRVFPGVPVLPTFGNNDGPVHNGVRVVFELHVGTLANVVQFSIDVLGISTVLFRCTRSTNF